jgi:hypothetical protein
MSEKPRWETRRLTCPEGDYTAELLIEWREVGGRPTVQSVSCNNPKLRGLDNWDCRWTCLDELTKKLEP